jgi:hypothetical protein
MERIRFNKSEESQNKMVVLAKREHIKLKVKGMLTSLSNSYTQ